MKIGDFKAENKLKSDEKLIELAEIQSETENSAQIRLISAIYIYIYIYIKIGAEIMEN